MTEQREHRFELPFVPLSLKNNVTVRKRRNGRRWPAKSEAVKNQQTAIAALVAQQLRAAGIRDLPFPDDEVELEVTRHVNPETIEIVVRSLGPKPAKGRTGRDRDTTNLTDSIADALQGTVYTDDRQVARVIARRVMDAETVESVTT